MEIGGRRVLVTGADGFIGSHLVELLVEKRAQVTALALYDSRNDWRWLEDLPCLEKVSVVTGDIRDPYFCLDISRGMEVVFHLAALIPIPYSYRAPASFLETNVAGTLNLCQAAVAAGVRRMVHTSTSEVYGTAQYVPIDEAHPLQPQSPYSATKVGADAIAKSFHCSFGLPVVVARPFNTYGPRQSARAVVPTIITQLATGRDEIALGDLETSRDLTFVKDTCRGLCAIAEMEGGEGEVFNVGTGTEIRIADLFRLIAQLMNRDASVHTDETRLRPVNSEVRRLCCDPRKLAAATGFRPQTTLRDGLCQTIDWFQRPENLSRYKADLYNV